MKSVLSYTNPLVDTFFTIVFALLRPALANPISKLTNFSPGLGLINLSPGLWIFRLGMSGDPSLKSSLDSSSSLSPSRIVDYLLKRCLVLTLSYLPLPSMAVFCFFNSNKVALTA